MSKIDLHIHSSYSADGEFSPQQILSLCREQGMQWIAITDHNSVRGVEPAFAHAGEIHVLSGVEFDCCHEGKNYHLLGYGFSHTRQEFAEIEKDIYKQEVNASSSRIRLFRQITGIPLNVSQLLKGSANGIVTGEQIAEALLTGEAPARYELLHPYLPGGSKSDMPYVRFYWDFFSEGKPAYVPIHYFSLRDAVSLIHDAGGIAVLAHPGQNLSEMERPALLPGLISQGIDGIEVFSSYHDNAATEYFLAEALKNNLLVTCGSDFHGKNKPSIKLGGHGAFWSDEKLISGLLEKLPGKFL